ncbi:hypothetical protein [Pontibacillus yanchengensis]|uniref:hypothetical protein n=1 Tax=Pontibacillus yanchengensis TaxID=462910 RepID=UPI0019274F58|nr:hypothetical protein [Pontibacillus yanchengensis]
MVNHGIQLTWELIISRNAIQEATHYVPEATFIEGDVYDQEVIEIIQMYQTLIILEVLEHLEEDIEEVASLPKGSRVVNSKFCTKF